MIEYGSSGESQSAVYSLCRKGMMKYWNIEPDILHGHQAFISAESVPCNEARVSPPTVRWRQLHKKDRTAPKYGGLMYCKVVCCCYLQVCSLQGLAADEGETTALYAVERSFHSQQVSFQNEKNLIIIYSWLWSNPLIILILSLDISLLQPKHHQTCSYCNGPSCIFGYTTPVHPPALTSSHQFWIW